MRIAVVQAQADALGRRLADRLGQRGHDVALVTSADGSTAGGVSVLRTPAVPTGLLARRSFDPALGAVPSAAAGLFRARPEVAHALSHLDAWAAVRAGRAPVVLTLPTAPTREWLLAARWRLAAVREAVERSAAVTVLEPRAAELVERYLFRRPELVAMDNLGRWESLYLDAYHRRA